MKVFSSLLITLLLLSVIQAQPPDSVNFLPLSIGNIYQYYKGPEFPIWTFHTTQDTIIHNKQYFYTHVFVPPLRVDSLGNIWSADSLMHGGDYQEEYLVLKADAKLGETWIHNRNIGPFRDSSHFECIEDDTVYAFGRMRRIKGTIFYYRFSIFYQWFMEGIGAVILSGEMADPAFLSYAKVNGKEYGKFVLVEKEEPVTANQFTVSQNYPNPFNGSTSIKITFPNNHKEETCQIKLYDVLGNIIYSEVIPVQGSIVYRLNTDNLKLSSGTYFYQIQSSANTITRKLILMR